MRFVLLMTAVIALTAFSPATATAADPPPFIDWRDFDEDMEDQGDHVVGEELCAAPGAAESLPGSFAVI